MRSRGGESRDERSERQREHRRERSCQGERAVVESERHHEYKRDVLGGESAVGCGGEERRKRNGWRGVRASEPEGEAQSDSQAGRPASKEGRQAGNQTGRQPGKQASRQPVHQPRPLDPLGLPT